MDDWLLDIIRTAGYAGILLLMFVENIIPMIPSELILPFAGYLVARGELSFAGVVGAGGAGSMAGASAWYVLGRLWGAGRVNRFIERYGHFVLLDLDDVKRAEAWFKRHERAATFVGRLVPGVRSLISLPAGVAKMGAPTFLAYTAAGTFAWTALLTAAGYFLAGAYDKAREVVGPIGSIVFGLVICTLIVRYVRRRRAA